MMGALGTWVADFKYGLRLLRRYPGFSVTAVLVLALGIGANAAIFSAVSSVMLAPLPFPHSDRLIRIVGTTDVNGDFYQSGVFPRYFDELKRRSNTLEAVTAQRYRNLTLTGAGDPERVVGIGVAGGWAETIGVKPELGRTFDAGEIKSGSDASVTVITHALWQRRFHGDSNVLERTLDLNGREYSVIGVMPPHFNFPYNTDLWLPLTVEPEAGAPGDLNVPARIKPGVAPQQAIAEMERIGRQISAETPGKSRRGLTGRTFAEEFPRDPDNAIVALLAAVGFVLLLACVNVANLQLARATGRTRESAIRTTLGATRWRQARQMLAESLVLATIAGALGVGLAYLIHGWLALLVPPRLGEVIQSVQLAPRVLVFTGGLIVLSAVLFGLAPALKLSAVSPAATLRSGGRFGTAASRLLSPLVVAQVALAFVLLVGAGLMARNFARLMNQGVGYDPAGLYDIGLGLPEPGYDDPQARINAVTAITEQVRGLPGVRDAGVTSLHPIPRTNTNTGVRMILPGMSPDDAVPILNERLVTPGYLSTVGIDLLQGREIRATDTRDGEPVAVISREAAKRYWPGENAIGQRFRPRAGHPWHTVVGVVNDIAEPNDAPLGTIYRAYDQSTPDQQPGLWDTTSVSLMVRMQPGAELPLKGLGRVVHEVDGSITLFNVSPMEALLVEPLEGQRLGTLLFLGFGAFGLLMAALGTYGVIALAVAARVREYGIRLALGIAPRRLWRMIVGQGMLLVGLGLLLGLAATVVLSPVVTAAMAEVAPRDPLVLSAAGAVLLAGGLFACWLPASRARRVDPAVVLRED